MAKKKYDTKNIKLKFKEKSEEESAKKLDQSSKHQVSEDDLIIKNSKISITLRIDADLLQKIKEEATRRDMKYQTLLNAFLRKHFIEDPSPSELFKMYLELQDRVEKLEKSA